MGFAAQALRDINAGETLTVDHSDDLSPPDNCTCASCLKQEATSVVCSFIISTMYTSECRLHQVSDTLLESDLSVVFFRVHTRYLSPRYSPILCYLWIGVGVLHLYKADLDRLEPGCLLNDVIMELGLRYDIQCHCRRF